MTTRWTTFVMVMPVIAGSLACNLGSATTDSNASDTASSSSGATDSASASGTDTAAETDTGGPAGTVTIYDVQQGKVPVDSIVQIKNVVVTTPVRADKGAVFVQEMPGGEYSGIYLYLWDEVVTGVSLAPGDVVNITGQYTEFYDFSEITIKAVTDIEVVSSGAVPEPAIVNPADIATGGAKAEAYEGVLVAVENVTVTNPDLGFGQFEVDSILRVSDFFFPNMGPNLSGGESIDKVVGPLMYDFEDFKIAPRSVNDLMGLGGGSTTTDTTTDTTTSDPTTTGGDATTIYDIQMGKVAINTPVTLTDVVVTSGLTFKKDAFFVEEMGGGEYSGIYVYIPDSAGLTIKPGDVVTIKGNYDEFFDNSQIEVASVADIMVTGTAPVPQPELVNPADIATGGPKAEAYEGVLVEVQGTMVTNPDLGFGEFEVTGALRVDDLFFAMADWPAVMMGDSFASIVGPLNFSYDDTKISPRTVSDLQK